MSKKKRDRALSDSEAKAVTRNLRVSPQKLNLLAQLIRGKKVSAALADLEFSRKRIARDVRKCLESAIANAENNHDLDVDDLVVEQAHVGKGRAHAAAWARFSSRSRTSLSWCAKSRRRLRGRRGEYYGSEGQSNRAAARHQPHVGLSLVRRQAELRFVAA
jgi:large subunit ribosomal protein L22